MYKEHDILAVSSRDRELARLWFCYGAIQGTWEYGTEEQVIRKTRTHDCHPYFLCIIDNEPKAGDLVLTKDYGGRLKVSYFKDAVLLNTAFEKVYKVIATDDVFRDLVIIPEHIVKEFARNSFKSILVEYSNRELKVDSLNQASLSLVVAKTYTFDEVTGIVKDTALKALDSVGRVNTKVINTILKEFITKENKKLYDTKKETNKD